MKIAIVTNDLYSTWLFRRPLIKALQEKGHKVTVITPPDEEHEHFIGEMKAAFIPVRVYRFFSPWADLQYVLRLRDVFKEGGFDVVHTFTIKPNIFGPLAARWAGISTVICSVTGLGYLFSDKGGLMIRFMRSVAQSLMKLSFEASRKVSFQNPEDLDLLVAAGVVDKEKAVLIKSSGVSLVEYSGEAVDRAAAKRMKAGSGCEEEDVVVTMIVARVAWEKGVREFVEASQILGQRRGNVKFLFVGPVDEASPDAVPESFLREKESRHFKWIGFTTQVREVLSISDIVVLPSCYREGIPRVLLEAMAMGKPVVTTDNVGCREAVDNGVTGYLVPCRDPAALADRIDELAVNRDQRADFGGRGREKVINEFDERIVVSKTLDEMYGIE